MLTHESYRASAFLEAARGLAEVTVATDRRQVLESLAPARNLTLELRNADAAVASIAAFHRAHPLAAIVAADDEGVEIAAAAAAALGLRQHPLAAVRRARSKRATRETLAAAGLAQPRFQSFSALDDPAAIAARARVRYPCVVKPVDLSMSRGVIRADDAASLAAAFARSAALLRAIAPHATRGAGALEMLVEEFVPGVEVALEGLVSGGRLITLALFDKPDPLNGPTFEETIYVTPSRHPEPLQRAIEEETRRAVAALGLTDGPVHAELRLAAAGPLVLEIAPRSIGGLCSAALRFGQGESLERLLLRHALDGGDPPERERLAAGVMMIPIPRGGRLERVGGLDSARTVPGIRTSESQS